MKKNLRKRNTKMEKKKKEEKFAIDITLRDKKNNHVFYDGKGMSIRKSVDTLLNLLEYEMGYVPPIFVLGKQNKLNWHKSDKDDTRHMKVLAACNNNYLQSARAMQQLTNFAVDPEARRKSWQDAKYFFLKHREFKKKQKSINSSRLNIKNKDKKDE